MSSTMQRNDCERAELVCAYAVHALPSSEVRAIEAHLASCAQCRRELETLRPVIDSFVFVVAWGSTTIKAVRRHLMGEPELHDRLLGVVLNKADLKVLERFEQPSLHQNGYYVNRG